MIFNRTNFVTVSGLRKIVILNYLQPVLVKVRAGTGFSRVHFEWSKIKNSWSWCSRC